jgi:hypothetical protein
MCRWRCIPIARKYVNPNRQVPDDVPSEARDAYRVFARYARAAPDPELAAHLYAAAVRARTLAAQQAKAAGK